MADNRQKSSKPRTKCPVCGASFAAAKYGAHEKQFCSPTCKSKRDRAYRNFAQHAVDTGQLTLAQLIKDHA